jgi:hypothetical protein
MISEDSGRKHVEKLSKGSACDGDVTGRIVRVTNDQENDYNHDESSLMTSMSEVML